MKPFRERNVFLIGAMGIALTVGVILAALQYDKLPFINPVKHYSGYFAESGGLLTGGPVEVSGFRVGSVSSTELDGPRVLVKFTVNKNVHLGERTEAVIRAKSLLGAKVLQIIPYGEQPLSTPIPIERTKSPYELPDALGDLTATISGLNTDELSDALSTLSDTFEDTPPALRLAVEGVARFSQTLDTRDAQLRNLLANANKATTVLAERADKVVSLVSNANGLLAQLRTESAALDKISGNLSAVSQQLSGFIRDNRAQLRPALDKLNGVLAILDSRKTQVQESLKRANQFLMSLGEALASGPFFKAYVANLLPGQFIQPFVDAAFSDLGLDPSVLLPSQRTDPQTGQPGTPPLPMPYPRTGQGGEPRQTLPDAITGNPDDPRYPYREPPPAPPPGGPPPGPPEPPEQAWVPQPTPSPVFQPAPGQVPSSPGAPPSPAPGPEEGQ